MAVVFDAKATSDLRVAAPAGANVDLTTLTVGSGPDRALVALVAYVATSGVSQTISATWDPGGANQTMALIGELNWSSTRFIRLYGFSGSPVLASGNKVLRFGTSAGCNSDFYCDAISFTGASQAGGSTTFHNFNQNSGSDSTASVSITSASGEIVVAAESCNNVSGFGISTVNNSLIFVDNTSGTISASGNYAAGAASVSMTATLITQLSFGAVGLSILASIPSDLEEFTPPVLRSRIRGQRALAIHFDSSMFLPLISAQIAARTLGWEVMPPQPPPLMSCSRVRSGAIARGNDGTQANLIRDLIPSGWEETPRDLEIPHPAPERRAAAVMRGDEGTQSRLDFLSKGWWIREVQPPHPRREKSGSIMPIEPGIQQPYFFFRPTFVEATLPVTKARHLSMVPAEFPAQFISTFISAAEWSMDVTEFLIRARRGPAIEIEPSFIPIRIPVAWGYEDASRVVHPRRRMRMTEPAQDRTPPFRLFAPWWDRVAPVFARARRRQASQPDVVPFPFARIGFFDNNQYLMIKRRQQRVTDPYRYVEKHFFPPLANGWEIQASQPQHRRQSRRWEAGRGVSQFATFLVPLPEGWQAYLVWPPHPRFEKGASVMVGDVSGAAWAAYVKLLVSGVVASDSPVWDAVSWDRLA